MQLISYSVLSSLVFAAATVQAAPPAHGIVNIARSPSSGHGHAAMLKRRAANPVPVTLQDKTKRATNSTTVIKRCRIRPTSSTALPTGTVVGSTSSTVTSSSSSSAAATSSAATSSSSSASSSSASPSPSAESNFSNQWKLGRTHQGASFFDGWDFWDRDDPTHGTVQFHSAQSAWDKGLISASNGQPAYMRSGTQDWVDRRDGIRIHDKEAYNINTLLLMDAEHMPTGCGVWPAWWGNGPNWPQGGEIDILEGVNNQPHNQATLHTSEGCTASSDPNHPSTGQLTNAQCGVINGDNTGCGFTDITTDNTYGFGFNEKRGGVYAMQWVESGIAVWFFTRDSIPEDIKANHPMPWTWKAPFARWAAATCDPNRFFYAVNSIFDITFCGDWAGSDGAWRGSGCADQTGFGSCVDYVRQKGGDFHEAFWAVNYVKYFTQNA